MSGEAAQEYNEKERWLIEQVWNPENGHKLARDVVKEAQRRFPGIKTRWEIEGSGDEPDDTGQA